MNIAMYVLYFLFISTNAVSYVERNNLLRYSKTSLVTFILTEGWPLICQSLNPLVAFYATAYNAFDLIFCEYQPGTFLLSYLKSFERQRGIASRDIWRLLV